MNNKRGFTIIEVMITLALAIGLIFSAIVIPTDLIQEYKDYTELVDHTFDTNKTKTALARDLESTYVKKLDENTIQIGESIYTFSTDGLYRMNGENNIKINDDQLFFEITNNNKALKVYSDKITLSYSINNSSFGIRE